MSQRSGPFFTGVLSVKLLTKTDNGNRLLCFPSFKLHELINNQNLHFFIFNVIKI